MTDQIKRLMTATPAEALALDAGLIRLAEDLLARATRLHRCDAGLLVLPDEEYEREQDLLHEGGQALMEMHPATMPGLIAKARTVRVQFERLVACDYSGTVANSGETHERLAWSLMNDLLEMTGSLDGMPTFASGIGGRQQGTVLAD